MDTSPLPSPAAPPVISVTGLRKSYDGRVVVDDLDLRVDAGEVVGLIGANGAGKTTTVECLQGLRRADAGAVRVLGFDPARDAERLRPLIGSQLQDSGLPDRLRVEEAVRLFAGPDAGDAEELLERFGLAHRRRLHFATMSGGERQRLFLVLALLNRPRLVILDELTQGLDPAARREVWRSVQQLRADGTTVLLVTHELEEAEALCDRVVVMQAGRVLDSGTPEELVTRHGGPVVVRFGLPAGRPAHDLVALRALPGVLDVERRGDRVAVHGRRSAIAHVGAWLVARGDVPDDLSVTSPDLEGALLALLDTPTTTTEDAA
ncbi:ABC transporter ATP-binding protein [Nocardioides sp. 1609]|uniref:ABC transporter ATP-binding protein n=1 Tax=Nocardioides sp. 1609 TaxID=2508327 RepID=UPI00106F9819|nr:ABC transporter ATP-binding protein [Nocardioides sp. 1609]